MRGTDMHPNEVAKYVTKKLKDAGVRLWYYKSMSSDSHYFKIDCGVAHSLRISDHATRKGHLSYRHTIITERIKGSRSWVDEKDMIQIIYGIDKIDLAISNIVKARKLKMMQYGTRYETFIDNNIDSCANHKKLHLFKEI